MTEVQYIDVSRQGESKVREVIKPNLLLKYMTSLASFLQDLALESSGKSWSNIWFGSDDDNWKKRLGGPSVLSVSLDEQSDLLARKFDLCSVIYNLQELNEGEKESDIKTATLEELLDLVENHFSLFDDTVLVDIVNMVNVNILRVLPPENMAGKFSENEKDHYEDPFWPHHSVIYQIFLKILEHPQFEPNSLKYVIKQSFVRSLFGLFESSDPREREVLKTILHRIYGDFIVLRDFIRHQIRDVCLAHIHGERRAEGISELLEVMGAIIKGLALPLRKEYSTFLEKVLIPLHKLDTMEMFSSQLTYCDGQMISKNQHLASKIIGGLLKLWPQTDCSIQVQFLTELGSLLEVTRKKELDKVVDQIFIRIGLSVNSQHFQVAQRGLDMWKSMGFLNLVQDHKQLAYNLLNPFLQRTLSHHWNLTVISQCGNVLDIMDDLMDEEESLELVDQNSNQVLNNKKT